MIKKNFIQAIKIDVDKKQVYPVTVENTLQGIYSALGRGCDIVEQVYLDRKTTLLVDEEGTFKADKAFFILNENATICQNGLVVGVDENGEHWTSTAKTLEQIRELIKFPA
jgi:hypothetical protein